MINSGLLLDFNQPKICVSWFEYGQVFTMKSIEMKKLLEKFKLEIGCFKYQFEACSIDWWNDGDPVSITIEIGQYEKDSNVEVSIWFENDEENLLAFQTTFLDNSVKRTFIAEAIAKNRFHSIELDFDDERMVYTTNSKKDSENILQDLLDCLNNAKLSSKSIGDENAYKMQARGQILSDVIEMVKENGIEGEPEVIFEFIQMLCENQGFEFVIELLEDIHRSNGQSEESDGDSLIDDLTRQVESFLLKVLKDMQIEFEDEDEELNDQQVEHLFLVLCQKSSTQISQKLGVSEAELVKQEDKLFATQPYADRSSLIDYLSSSEHLNLYNLLD